jgi:hypothetical protein
VGEKQNHPFQLFFNASLKIDFQGSRVTSDGGLILVREVDERLGFSELAEQHLTDPRGKNIQLRLANLLWQSVYNHLPGSPKRKSWLNDIAQCNLAGCHWTTGTLKPVAEYS